MKYMAVACEHCGILQGKKHAAIVTCVHCGRKIKVTPMVILYEAATAVEVSEWVKRVKMSRGERHVGKTNT